MFGVYLDRIVDEEREALKQKKTIQNLPTQHAQSSTRQNVEHTN